MSLADLVMNMHIDLAMPASEGRAGSQLVTAGLQSTRLGGDKRSLVHHVQHGWRQRGVSCRPCQGRLLHAVICRLSQQCRADKDS